MFRVHWGRMQNLMCWDERLCKCQLCALGLLCHLRPHTHTHTQVQAVAFLEQSEDLMIPQLDGHLAMAEERLLPSRWAHFSHLSLPVFLTLGDRQLYL